MHILDSLKYSEVVLYLQLIVSIFAWGLLQIGVSTSGFFLFFGDITYFKKRECYFVLVFRHFVCIGDVWSSSVFRTRWTLLSTRFIIFDIMPDCSAVRFLFAVNTYLKRQPVILILSSGIFRVVPLTLACSWIYNSDITAKPLSLPPIWRSAMMERWGGKRQKSDMGTQECCRLTNWKTSVLDILFKYFSLSGLSPLILSRNFKAIFLVLLPIYAESQSGRWTFI